MDLIHGYKDKTTIVPEEYVEEYFADLWEWKQDLPQQFLHKKANREEVFQKFSHTRRGFGGIKKSRDVLQEEAGDLPREEALCYLRDTRHDEPEEMKETKRHQTWRAWRN